MYSVKITDPHLAAACYRYKEKVKGESLDARLTRIRGSLARQLILESMGLFNGCNLFVNGNLC
jgi:hypothetical protein